MEIPLFQVDAFTNQCFRGNPAAVCPLEQWLPDETLQSIAAENNCSETAFLVRSGEGYHLRWMTPTVEVNLCGHATLAAAWVIFEHLDRSSSQVRFSTKSGPLTVMKEEGSRLAMDFPARPPQRIDEPPGLAEALGAVPIQVWNSRDWVAVYDSAEEVARLQPDMSLLKALSTFGVIATAPGTGCDFVSRFFAPAQGVPEDPVTGSAHCTLVPYWAQRTGKPALYAKQISARGGEIWCELLGDRVKLSGQVVPYFQGVIRL